MERMSGGIIIRSKDKKPNRLGNTKECEFWVNLNI